MSGHSHWSTIKHKKQANDKERGKLFSKVSREIIMAINTGGGVTDPDNNITLRSALDKAREVNMPKENIERLIERVTSKAENLTEVIYEALGPNGISLLIKTTSDNPRRTQTEVKIVLDKNGGKIVEKGAVMYMFDLCGRLEIKGKTEEEALNLTEALGGNDLEKEEDTFIIYFNYESMSRAWQKAKEHNINKVPELFYRPKSYIDVTEDKAKKTIDLLNKLDELDDVQELYTNINII
jgi:YebC/PmpR family DNA-binding regulatory protein